MTANALQTGITNLSLFIMAYFVTMNLLVEAKSGYNSLLMIKQCYKEDNLRRSEATNRPSKYREAFE